LSLLKLLGNGRSLALHRGIGKSDGRVGQGRKPGDPCLEGCVAGDPQDAAVALFGDLQGDQQALVLHAPGDVQTRAIVANSRLSGAVDHHAGLGHAVSRQRRLALPSLDAGSRARLRPASIA
jgi:hypothetical protein